MKKRAILIVAAPLLFVLFMVFVVFAALVTVVLSPFVSILLVHKIIQKADKKGCPDCQEKKK